jgi:flavin reductase (DIM6/NTAB) family NADH-FMN oxidoreductase RutF
VTDTFLLPAGVDARELRTALGHFATGVAVITARDVRGPVGMTVNSFCSVSLDPPLVLFCVGHRSQLRSVLSRATSYAVNVLGADQEALSRRFASPGFDRFGATRWRPGTTGSPVLVDALAVLECITERVVETGDHDIVLGRVATVHPLGTGREPLVFFSGGYRQLA